MSHRVEAVTVCVGYGDILAVTMAENLTLLDSLLVVTSKDDTETHKVCKRHSVPYIATEEYRRSGPFNKARMIQRGLDSIGGRDWILHLDADVVLPQKFRRLTDWAHLDERFLYGADRCNVTGWESWQALKRHVGSWDNHAHSCGHWFHPKFPVGSRWVSDIHGYVPCGFFQLFSGAEITQGGYHVKRYPFHHGDAARTDIQFGLQWDRQFRQVLPEIICLHLDSEESTLGANWQGRTTKRFGPEFRAEPPKQHPPSHHPEPPRHHHPEPPKHHHEPHRGGHNR